MADVAEAVLIDAPAQRVWELVSDVTRMGQWSPETRSCQWKGGATRAERGARFVGRNRNGMRRWSTTCVVTAAEPGSRFAFEVSSLGMLVAHWSYSLAPAGSGCELTETMVDQRRLPMRVIGRLATGVGDRATHNRAGIKRTLAAIKVASEAQSTA